MTERYVYKINTIDMITFLSDNKKITILNKFEFNGIA